MPTSNDNLTINVHTALEIKRLDGLTDEEGKVADALIDAVQAYWKLPVQHPDETRDFVEAIHRCQDQLAIRIARRHYPIGWPVKA